MPPTIPLLLWFAPLFLGFEVWQLVLAERHIGVKQIARGTDPREHGPGELVSFCWVLGILCYWLWMFGMIWPRFGRAEGACMLVVSLLGLSLRRQLGLRWGLVVLTLEGAIRIGMIASLLSAAWRALTWTPSS